MATTFEKARRRSAYQQRRELFPECRCPPLEHVPLEAPRGATRSRRRMRDVFRRTAAG